VQTNARFKNLALAESPQNSYAKARCHTTEQKRIGYQQMYTIIPTMMLSSSRIVAAAVGRSQTQTNRLFSLRATKAATSMPLSSSRVASAAALGRSRVLARRWLSESKTGATETVAKETAAPAAKEAAKESKGYWHSAEFWGALGALAGWGMYVLLFVCCCSFVHLNYLL
jgi:hypothetical protein